QVAHAAATKLALDDERVAQAVLQSFYELVHSTTGHAVARSLRSELPKENSPQSRRVEIAAAENDADALSREPAGELPQPREPHGTRALDEIVGQRQDRSQTVRDLRVGDRDHAGETGKKGWKRQLIRAACGDAVRERVGARRGQRGARVP